VNTEEDRSRAFQVSAVSLWLGFLVPPAMALLNLMFSFVLGHIACQTGYRIGLHVFMLASLTVIGVAGFIAWRGWSALGEDDPGQLSGPVGSRRLLALVGMVSAALSGFVVVAQWFPVFVLPPCIRT
jgi:hypothetical protein